MPNRHLSINQTQDLATVQVIQSKFCPTGFRQFKSNLSRCIKWIRIRFFKSECKRRIRIFIFDTLPHAETVLAVEGVREEEFAPVKNRTGLDSLESAQRMVAELHWKWLEARGATAPRGPDGELLYPCEIHPLCALGPEDLPEDIAGRIPESGPVYLE